MSTSITKNNALRLALAFVAGVALVISALPFATVSADDVGYVINADSPVVNDNDVSIDGTAAAHYQTGADSTQNMSIDWGDGNGWQTTPSPGGGGVTSDGSLSFEPEFTNHGSSNRSFDASWNASKTYSDAGTYTIKVKVHHGRTPGQDGSDEAKVTSTITIEENGSNDDEDNGNGDEENGNGENGNGNGNGEGDNGAETFTLFATKLVCDSTDDLPNWSGSGELIEAKTATQYAQNNDGCTVDHDWQFQWTPTEVSTTVEDDNSAELAGWTTFSGSETIEIDDFSEISVREVMLDGYLSFTAENTPGAPSEPSAELWCHDDVLNYDNLEYIDVEDGGEYHCVAFNVKETPQTETFTFEGHKYEVFADSETEEPVEGWEMSLFEDGASKKDWSNAVATTSTDADGYFKFELELESDQSPSNYYVMEEFREDWKFDRLEVDGEVQPENMYGCRVPEFSRDSVEIMVGDFDGESQDSTSVMCDFFNQQVQEEPVFTFSGNKFEDEVTEGPGLADWEFALVVMADGPDFTKVLATTTTDETGYFEFEIYADDLPFGFDESDLSQFLNIAYVEEVLPEGWEQEDVLVDGVSIPNHPVLETDEMVCYVSMPTFAGREGEGGDVRVAEFPSSIHCDFVNSRDADDGNGDDSGQDDEPQQPTQRQSGNAANAQSAGRVAGAATSTEPDGEVLGEATRQCGPLLNTYMRHAQTNESQQVMILQAFLTGQGINTPLTGEFDSTTDKAVRDYQARYKSEILTPWYEAGLVSHENPTGYVYKLTRHKINNTVCPGSEDMPELN